MFILLGVVFIAYEGTYALSGLYEENGAVDVAYDAEQWARSLANIVPDALLLALALVAALLLALRAYRRRQRKVREVVDDGAEEFARR
jgi:hypothetical protein